MPRILANLVRFYLLGTVACILTGLGLSALRLLTPASVLGVLPFVFIGLLWVVGVEPKGGRAGVGHPLKIFRRRFRRPIPCLFLIVVVLVFLGGLLYAPNNTDALTYRLPRMLNWFSNHGWNWIATNNERLNYSGTAWEWMAMPLLALHTDRALFLINAVGFLLLPGLLFSIFRGAGVSRRVAWNWMWLLPMGFGYALQAGSVGNDLTGAMFCLIAIHYGFRARRSGRVEDVWLVGLAAAVMTGMKFSNLPLGLPCLVAVAPALHHLRQRWAVGVAMAALALVVSFVPTALMNQKYAGGWTGDPQNRSKLELKSPVAGLIGNSVLVAQQLLMPPFLPNPGKIDSWMKQNLPEPLKRCVREDFPRFFKKTLNELPQEEAASLGIAVSCLLAMALSAQVAFRRKPGLWLPRRSWRSGVWVGVAACVSGFVFMAKMGSEADARLMLPYYPLMMLPILAASAQNGLVRSSVWRVLAVLASLCVLPCLILTPSRPLWPALSVVRWLDQRYPGSPLAVRVATVYVTYANRNECLAPLRELVPQTVKRIGFVAGSDDASYALWRPLGSREVISLQDATGKLRSVPSDVEWIVVRRAIWPEVSSEPFETWIASQHFSVVDSIPIRSFASNAEQIWTLLRAEKPKTDAERQNTADLNKTQ